MIVFKVGSSFSPLKTLQSATLCMFLCPFVQLFLKVLSQRDISIFKHFVYILSNSLQKTCFKIYYPQQWMAILVFPHLSEFWVLSLGQPDMERVLLEIHLFISRKVFFFNSFIEIYCKVCLFKVNSSVVFSIFWVVQPSLLSNLEHFHHPRKINPLSISHHSPLHLPFGP